MGSRVCWRCVFRRREFRIPFELMRIYSPSAEVQGHGPGQEVLQTGKRNVELAALEPVGNYAVQPTLPMATTPASSPGTSSISWDRQQGQLWRDYERRLREAGVERDAPMPEKGRHTPAAIERHDMSKTHFGFETVDEATRRPAACAACSTPSRRATT
jgi:DUF971 family protein